MKKLPAIFAVLISIIPLACQADRAVRLALIAQNREAGEAADLLTAKWSGDTNVLLLERQEIQKIYDEQGLSAAHRDDAKLGHILGADGLLFFELTAPPAKTRASGESSREPENFLTLRLVAVKPGVILTESRFRWNAAEASQWADGAIQFLRSLLPKLALAANEAIPISVLNLRSALQSIEAQETESQLKQLILQRLSKERQFFVLERQRMGSLTDEKNLNADESAFWSGRYLLEGVVDQNGYAKDVITINARLTPPKVAAPILFEARGSRTNLSEVINQLAVKTAELLQVHSPVQEWNPDAEAVRYFEEAQWALRWGLDSEARAAADSAWALGKHDMDCAKVQVRAYKPRQGDGRYRPGESSAPRGLVDVVEMVKKDAARDHQFGLKWNKEELGESTVVRYVSTGNFPDSKDLDLAIHSLQLYYRFSRTLPASELKPNSPWYLLGIEVLTSASAVLQHFHFVPSARASSGSKLPELRRAAREVAGWILESPEVNQGYFVGNRLATHDELAHSIEEQPNIFGCKVLWGCFWQERPEDSVGLYRELMNSPVFCYLHAPFWIRELQTPRLVAWNEQDESRLPQVWNGFLGELTASTNLLLRMEAKALALADAQTESELTESFTNFFSNLIASGDAMVTNSVEVLYSEWGATPLVASKTSGGIVTKTKEQLQRLYHTEYVPKLTPLREKYWAVTVPSLQFLAAFEKQRQYLKSNAPYDFFEFSGLFSTRNYSSGQALEIQPLIQSYKSNLVFKSETAPGAEKGKLMGAIAQVGFLQNHLSLILTSPAKAEPTRTAAPKLEVTAPRPAPAAIEHATEIATNILCVDTFLKISDDRIQGRDIAQISPGGQCWSEGNFLIEFGSSRYVSQFNAAGELLSTRQANTACWAIYRPGQQGWDIIDRPVSSYLELLNASSSSRGHGRVLFHGDLYSCNAGRLDKFRSKTRQWQNLAFPLQDANQLFATEEHLFAAGPNTIFEILNDTQIRVLLSTRRRPTVSVLDSLENLGVPSLFGSLDGSLLASVANKMYRWDQKDWQPVLSLSYSSPEDLGGAIVFRSLASLTGGDSDKLWVWRTDQAAPELCLREGYRPLATGIRNLAGKTNDPVLPPPLWQSPPNDRVVHAPATLFGSNLYFLVDHADISKYNGRSFVLAKDGYHAKLVCLSRDLTEPIVVPLKFNVERAQPPLRILEQRAVPWLAPVNSIHFAGDRLYLGQCNLLGLWAVPIVDVEAAVAQQKKVLFEAKAKSAAERERIRQALLAKYDRDRNGILSSDEKEEALDDPLFITFDLEAIDPNRNGWLDAQELLYFDANGNRLLEPKEQAGIELVQKLLTPKLLKTFDSNHDGVLDRSEFENLYKAGLGSYVFFDEFDSNHNSYIELDELETFLKQRTPYQIAKSVVSPNVRSPRDSNSPSLPKDHRQIFRQRVEEYWKTSK